MISLAKDGDFEKPSDMIHSNTEFTIRGNYYTITLNKKLLERGLLSVDLEESPAHMDHAISDGEDAGETRSGIFRMIEGRLETCREKTGMQRLRTFDTDELSSADLAVFVRLLTPA